MEENLKGDVGMCERIILKLILEKSGMKLWTEFDSVRMGYNDGFL
jgi:hypothetical protein